MRKKVKAMINTPLAKLPNRYVDLYEMQKAIGKELRKQKRAFKKQGLKSAIPEEITKLRTGNTKASVKHYVAEASAYLRRMDSTPKGYRQKQAHKRKAIEEVIGKKFKNAEEFDSFGKFMGDIQERAGNMWEKISDIVIELWNLANKLNLNTSLIIENYEYWLDHIKDIEELNKRQVGKIKKEMENAESEEEAIKILGFESTSKYYKRIDRMVENARKGKKGR